MSGLNQKTVKNKVSFNGIGLHSGISATINIKPAAPNTGIIFKRIDLDKDNLIFPNYILQKNSVNKAIKFVKMGKVKEAEMALRAAVKYLIRKKCKKIILGCTELPIAIFSYKSFKKAKESKLFIDPNLLLAQVCMKKYKKWIIFFFFFVFFYQFLWQ